MANTNFTVNDPLAVKLWAKKLAVQAIQQTWFRNFISDDGNNVIYMLDDAKKSAGDTVNVGLRIHLAGAGVQGDGTLEGQEEAPTTYTSTQVSNGSIPTNERGASFLIFGSMALTTALAANDVVQLVTVPNGYKVLNVTLDVDPLDVNASPTLTARWEMPPSRAGTPRWRQRSSRRVWCCGTT